MDMNSVSLSNAASGEDSLYCSALSRQSDEDIFGSATRTETYLLLEYKAAWGAKAIPESKLPEAVKALLGNLVKELPACKALLIRSDRRRTAPGFTFFVVISSESNPGVYAFHLAKYEDLLVLDIPAILEDRRQFESQQLEQPLYLVCTNGRRDKCCAKFGLPVYQALDQMAGEIAGDDNPSGGMLIPAIWQCSHIGGHRFAVNLACLPHGLLYGRVDPQNAADILAADQRGQLHLPNLRGRTCYEGVAQAAEYLLRKATGERTIDAYRLQEVETLAPDHWRVSFRQDLGTIHQVCLQVSASEQQIYQGCALDKQTPIKTYQMTNYLKRAP